MVKTRSKERLEQQWQQDYLFARPSNDELKVLQKEFVSSRPVRPVK